MNRFAHAPALAAAVSILLASARADSEPRVQFPTEQPAPVSARVALLETRMHALERRLAAFDKVGLSAGPDGSYRMAISGASVSIERDGRVTVVPAPPKPGRPAVTGRMPEDCDPPFFIDREGTKIPKADCLTTSKCDPPYTFDAAGIKRFIPECL
jgi:hypothetical protein